ncbi:hypothetical protein BDZ91DRAFT_799993 [Kalaharituber pfeilii]|nr:hypothetical protein BDZ91DRAFT_799993 [Kalaharituber pfeilii]
MGDKFQGSFLMSSLSSASSSSPSSLSFSSTEVKPKKCRGIKLKYSSEYTVCGLPTGERSLDAKAIVSISISNTAIIAITVISTIITPSPIPPILHNLLHFLHLLHPSHHPSPLLKLTVPLKPAQHRMHGKTKLDEASGKRNEAQNGNRKERPRRRSKVRWECKCCGKRRQRRQRKRREKLNSEKTSPEMDRKSKLKNYSEHEMGACAMADAAYGDASGGFPAPAQAPGFYPQERKLPQQLPPTA